MKKILTLMLMVAGTDVAYAQSEAARRYPFCMVGRDFAGVGDCIFESYSQCQQSASGREASCSANPYYIARPEPVASPTPPPEPAAAKKKRASQPQQQQR